MINCFRCEKMKQNMRMNKYYHKFLPFLFFFMMKTSFTENTYIANFAPLMFKVSLFSKDFWQFLSPHQIDIIHLENYINVGSLIISQSSCGGMMKQKA